jgi:hypothetical protein
MGGLFYARWMLIPNAIALAWVGGRLAISFYSDYKAKTFDP